MSRTLILIYGLFCYLVFFASFVYLIGFVAGGGVGVPKGVDDGVAAAWPVALAVNIGLIALFAIQHTVMARDSFKRAWTRLVPEPAERSTYVLLSSLVLIVLYLFWQPMPATVWSADAGWLRGLLWAGFLFGWGLLFVSTFVFDHFELFGLRQVWSHWRGTAAKPVEFKAPGPYKWVRHPMMTGFVLAFWVVPDMSVGHLLFSTGMTVYILIGMLYEERDLAADFGQPYRDYQKQVPQLLPWRRKSG